MTIEWNQNLATGVEEIDNQHKELFNRVNMLFEACRQCKGREEVSKLVKFLEEYVVTHFGTEEKYMTRYGYPDYPSHKEQHTNFIKDFLELKKQFEMQGETLSLTIKINKKIVDWLIQHIGKVDMKMGVFLKNKM